MTLGIHSYLQLFAGLLVSLESLPVWVSWFQYLSFMRYATEVQYNITQYINMQY